MRTSGLAIGLVAGVLLAAGCRTEGPRVRAHAANAEAARGDFAPIALERLAGRHWVWRGVGAEAAPAEPAVTLAYADGRLTGRSGCNRYTATVKPGARPGEVAVGPIASTRMMCPEPAFAVESRFLAALARTVRIGMRGDALVLVTPDANGQSGTLSFTEHAGH